MSELEKEIAALREMASGEGLHDAADWLRSQLVDVRRNPRQNATRVVHGQHLREHGGNCVCQLCKRHG